MLFVKKTTLNLRVGWSTFVAFGAHDNFKPVFFHAVEKRNQLKLIMD